MIPEYAWPFPHPWEECGEVFYGWMHPSWVSHMDFSIPRRCNWPKGHRGACDYVETYRDAGGLPLRENKFEKNRRLREEAFRRRRALREAVQ